MRRRSGAGPERANSRRRNTKAQKRRGGLKTPRLRNSSAGDHRTQSDIAQLTLERDEALEREKATAEVLRVISSSPGELEPVFESLLANAVRLCEAKFGNLYHYAGGEFRHVAAYNTPTALIELRRRGLIRPNPKSVLGRVATTKSVVHVADVATEQPYLERDPFSVASVELGGIRTPVRRETSGRCTGPCWKTQCESARRNSLRCISATARPFV